VIVLALRDEISLDGQQALALVDLFRSIRVFGKWIVKPAVLIEFLKRLGKSAEEILRRTTLAT
jgi:hypothetical protein